MICMTFASLLRDLGKLDLIASRLGVSVQAVSNMRARNSVGPAHWPALVALAAEVGVQGVSIDRLAEMYRAPATQQVA